MKGEQLQKIVEATKDRITGVPGITRDSLIPVDTPDIEAIIFRDVKRSVAEVENRVKLALFPKRRTDLPKTPKEAYENKEHYSKFGAINDTTTLNYPTWDDLTLQQKSIYGDSTLYTPGTLDWDLLNRVQREYLTKRIGFIPEKSGPAEIIDGKGRAYIKLYNRNIIKIHSIRLQVPNWGAFSAMQTITYSGNEVLLYPKEGGFQIIPGYGLFTMMQANWGSGVATGYGLGAPKVPQLIRVDYTYGLEEIPEDLVMAISLKTAINVFETVNMLFTMGLSSYSVSGFSASFARGLYADVIERYTDRAEQILNRYQYVNLTAW